MPFPVFGAGAVQTAYVSFLALDIRPIPDGTGSVTLIWPTSYVNAPNESGTVNVLAASMTVNTALSNTKTVTLPDATMSSVGSNFIITNTGAAAFNLLKSGGSLLVNIASGISYWVQLTDNSTSAGIWQYVQFGAGTSAATPGPLAGFGLTAIGSTLNTNVPVSKKNADYPVASSDRAKLIVWETTAGNGTITLPTIAGTAGFYVSFNNESTVGGVLTIDRNGARIDGVASNLNLQPKQSLTIISDGTEWWTLGFGQNSSDNYFANGNAAGPSISFTNDHTTGIFYSPANPYLGFSISGSEVFNIKPFAAGPIPAALNMVAGSVINIESPLLSTTKTTLSTTASSTNIDFTNTSGSTSASLTLSAAISSSTLKIAQGTNNISFKVSSGATPLDITYPTSATVAIRISNAGVVTFPSSPGSALPIASGGTGQITRAAAINALMPTTVNKFLAYFDGTNWVPTAGTATDGFVLKLVGGIPTWIAP